METLADVAGAALGRDAEAAAAAPAPNGRRTALEVARAKLEKANDKVATAQAAAIGFEAAYKACRLGHPQRAKRETDMLAAKTKFDSLKAEQAVHVRKFEELEQKEAKKTAKAEAKLKDANEKLEAAKVMTDNGMCTLVTERLAIQYMFDNKAHKNDKLWDVVQKKYQAHIDDNILPRSDARSVSSLKAKYSTLQGVFKLYINKVARANREAIGRLCSGRW